MPLMNPKGFAKLERLVRHMRGEWERPKRPAPKGPSKHEQAFQRYWTLLGGPPLTPQYKFHPKRKWRLDFAVLPARVAIELHGGVWSGGRHTRGKGFADDREKMNAAQEAGWLCYELTPDQINAETVERIIRQARGRMQ